MLHSEHRTKQRHAGDLTALQRDSNLADADEVSTPRDQFYLESLTEHTKNLSSYHGDDQEHGSGTRGNYSTNETSKANMKTPKEEDILEDIKTVDPNHTDSKYANYTYKSMVDPVITNRDVEESERRVKELSRQMRSPHATDDVKNHKGNKHTSAEYSGINSGSGTGAGASLGSGSGSGSYAENSDGVGSGSNHGNGFFSKLGFGHRKSKSEDTNQGATDTKDTNDVTYNMPSDSQYQAYFEEVPDQQGTRRGADTTDRNVNIKSRAQKYNDGGNYVSPNAQRNVAAANAIAAGAATGAPTGEVGEGFTASRNAYGDDYGYIDKDSTQYKNASHQAVKNSGATDDNTQSKGFTDESTHTGKIFSGKSFNRNKDSSKNEKLFGKKSSRTTEGTYRTGDPAYSSAVGQEQYNDPVSVVHDDEYYSTQNKGYGNLGSDYSKNYGEDQFNESMDRGNNDNQGVWSSITNYLGMGGNSEEQDSNHHSKGSNMEGTYGYEDEMPGGLNLQNKSAYGSSGSKGYNNVSGYGGSGGNSKEAAFEPSLIAPSGASPSENQQRAKQHYLKSQKAASSGDQQYYGSTHGEGDLYDLANTGSYNSSGIANRGLKGSADPSTGAVLAGANEQSGKKDAASNQPTDSTPYRMVQNPKNEKYLKAKNADSLRVDKNAYDDSGYIDNQGSQGRGYSNQFVSRAGNADMNTRSHTYDNHQDLAYGEDKGGKRHLESQRLSGKNQIGDADLTSTSNPIEGRNYGKTGVLSSSSHSAKNDGYYAGTKTKNEYYKPNTAGTSSSPAGVAQPSNNLYGDDVYQELSSDAKNYHGKSSVGGTTGRSGRSSDMNNDLNYNHNDATTSGITSSAINPDQAYGNPGSGSKYGTEASANLSGEDNGMQRNMGYSNVSGSNSQSYGQEAGGFGNSALDSKAKGGQFVRDKDGKYDYKTTSGGKNIVTEPPVHDESETGKHKKSENQGLSKIKNLFTGKDKKGKKEVEKKDINEHGTVFGGSKSGQYNSEGSNFIGNKATVPENSDANYTAGAGNRAYASDSNYTSGNYISGRDNRGYTTDENYTSGAGSRTHASDTNYSSGTATGRNKLYTSDANYVGGATSGKTQVQGSNYLSGRSDKANSSAGNYISGDKPYGSHHIGGGKTHISDQDYSLSASNKAFKDAEYSHATGGGSGGNNSVPTYDTSVSHAAAHHGQQNDDSLPNYEEVGQHRRKKSLIESIKDVF